MSDPNSTNPFAPFPFNETLYNNPLLCTFQTCPSSFAASLYRPSLAGNALYLAIFVLCLVIQVFFGIRHHTKGFMAGMICGCILEITGYIGRIMINNNQFDGNGFLIQITTLTIAPACFAASIYLCLSRVVIVFGERVSRFKPRTYTLFFIVCDVISLVIQASGGVTASMSDGNTHIQNAAINVMVAGIAFQVVSLAVFIAACTEFGIRVQRVASMELNPRFVDLRATRRFQLFLWALGLATLAVFVRSVFRCAELKDGFQGKLANNQVTFMVLERAMVVSAVLLLTAFHPGTVFGPSWKEAHWHLRKSNERKAKLKEKEEQNKKRETLKDPQVFETDGSTETD